jgi:hypothetical protein
MGEVWSRANKQNGVGVDQSAHLGDVDLVVWRWARNTMQLDTKVTRRLNKRSMSCIRNDPLFESAEYQKRERFESSHFGFRHASFSARPVTCGQTGHEDGFSTTAGRHPRAIRRAVKHCKDLSQAQ